MRVGFVFAALAVALVGATAPARAFAQGAVQTRFFDEQARAAYARGDYEQALADFLEVQRISPSPRTLYNVALAAELAHRDSLAFWALDAYLAGPADDETRRTDARARLDAMSRRLALVRVTSTPPGATIWVDRRELGASGTTPRTLVLSPGPHTVELTHELAEDARGEAVAEVGVTRPLDLTLTPRRGTVRVELTPRVASTITLTPVAGSSPPLVAEPGVAIAAPIGQYRLAIRADGYREVEDVLLVREGSEMLREAVLDPLPRRVGVLAIRTDDVVARVIIDDVERAETPARIPGIDVGTHRVELVAEGRAPWSGEVEVREARVTYVNATLVPAE